jgi:FeS assembly SUF system protein
MFWGRRKKEGHDVPNEDSSSAEQDLATRGDQTPQDTAIQAGTTPGDESAVTQGETSEAIQIRDRIIAVLKTVYDPEIPVDIYELGLVYGVEVSDDAEVHVTMTLTTPMCPVAETLPPEVEDKVRNVLGVKDVSLDLVWDPPWSVDMMSDAARLELNLM